MNSAPVNEVPQTAEGAGDATRNRFLAWIEFAVAALMALSAAAFAFFMSDLIGAGGIETAEDYLHLTPDFFPRLTMIILAAVCTRYAYGAARGLAVSSQSYDPEFLPGLQRAGFMVVVAVFYATSISWLGFIFSTMLMATVISYFLGLRNPLAYLPGVVVVPIVVRFAFERWLFIALPRSEIELIAVSEDAVIRFLLTVQAAVIAALRLVYEAVT